MRRPRPAILWTVTAVYAALLAGTSLLPSGPDVLGGWDTAITPTLQNALHVPAYAGLAALAGLAIGRLSLGRLVLIALACFALGILLECAQTQVRGRTGSVSDALHNLAGAVIGCLAIVIWNRARPAEGNCPRRPRGPGTARRSRGSMIEGRTILCFASGYDAPPTSKHHVMHLLAERNTVLWVNYHASRTPSASASDLRYMARKLGQVLGGMRKVRENLHVLTPLVLPLPGSAWARRLNRKLLVHQIRRALTKVGRGPVQVWSFTPDISYLLGRFGEEKVLYYCVDDFASFTGYDRDQVLRDEADLCRRADLVVTTSQALQDAKAPLNPNTILVTHGVDYEHFSRAAREDLPVPEDLKAIPHPILGFFGLLRDWVDLDLLAEVARLRPDWHIVLIGDADSTVDLASYRGVANMHFLGRRPYADLPAYCRGFDVGLIPFKINELTRAVNPIKMKEYLAAGLPVVSTPLPEMMTSNPLITTGEGPEAFASAIEYALTKGLATRQAGVRAMAIETWAGRVRTVCKRLESSACHQENVSP
ncbi:MAG: VanZ family protein [Planctomycetes bacterium]|nr:VanZ family protein [Planctomycetota bacterium]